MPMTYAEQISAFETKRASLVASNDTIMTKAAEDGATLDASQKEEFDGNQSDITEIDDHLKRLKSMEASNKAKAVPAAGGSREEAGTSRGGERIQVKRQEQLEPGIAFARLVKSLGCANGDMSRAVRIAASRYGEDSDAVGTLKAIDERGGNSLFFPGIEAMMQKTAVTAGSVVSGNWAADLVLTEGGAFADFAEYLRPETIVGKLQGLRRVPFDTALGISTVPGAGYWVGEGLPKPLTSFNFDKTTLSPLKCANIVVLTEELLRRASYSAETEVRTEMKNALIALIDTAFIDPSNSGTANVKPASVTNGAPHSAASGTGDADDIRADIRSLINEFIAANSQGGPIVLVMRATDALSAGMMVNALGQAEFPKISMNGGELFPGLQVITSQTVPSGVVAALQPSDIYLGDDDGFMVDVSREASLEMLTNPTNASADGTATAMVSLWQTNSVGFRCERIINWKRRRATAVAYLTGVAWGGSVNDLS
jgi:HK97 family phage major capsid protein